MAIDALVKPFLRLELFQGLKPLQLTEIVRQAERIAYKPGSVIMSAGQPGDAAVLIVSDGAVRTIGPDILDRPQPVAPGSLLGELAMLVEHVYGSTVIAHGPVRALRIPRAAMHAMMLEDRALADHFVGKIASRLSRVAEELRRIDSGLALPVAPSPGLPA